MSGLSNERIFDSDEDLSGSENEVFQAPRGFKKVKDMSSIKALTPQNLKNKEVWLIQVPSDFNVKKLKKLPVNFNLGENTDFNLKGTDYTLHEDLLAAEESTLKKKYKIMSAQDKDKLQPVTDLRISRFYSISEKVKIPEIDYSKVVSQRKDVKQHDDLRMRHFPTGYGSNDYEEAKKEQTKTSSPKKRKSEDSPKKDKKHKKDKKKKELKN
ncbi:hypothetical protein OGAPHI_004228 [Ogataea philodendri]|uniref:DNA-directed RNA polymerase I subunit RPA34 n=1 Tax=Ogataea philodendri TaxID=1378263 RepID=A0A9P8P6V2_9ASCO|nr:uncharacterized protein OGAPHI_004228 [Ogataea philodendri]KAH3666039.1 hypothetical protein OGAPHI_004228 [Ogataea philodendri]